MTRKFLLSFVLSSFIYRAKGQENFSVFTDVPQTPMTLKLSSSSPATKDVVNTDPRTTDDLNTPVPTDFSMAETQLSLATPTIFPGICQQNEIK